MSNDIDSVRNGVEDESEIQLFYVDHVFLHGAFPTDREESRLCRNFLALMEHTRSAMRGCSHLPKNEGLLFVVKHT